MEGHGGHFSSPLLFSHLLRIHRLQRKKKSFSLFSHDLQNGRVSSCHDCYHCFFLCLNPTCITAYHRCAQVMDLKNSKRPLLQLGEGEIVHKAKQNTFGKKLEVFFPKPLPGGFWKRGGPRILFPFSRPLTRPQIRRQKQLFARTTYVV